ncbi:hypothetical protein ACKI1J_23155 [Streptomyces scabiei]|uniref:hypothetical protein n=1 Tax=Streptomyces scabiei TaxID=1930 RepID=UPI0038F63806
MPTAAEELLAALEPLSFPARLTPAARTARRLADAGTLAPLLTGLDGHGPYERRLAAPAGSSDATRSSSRPGRPTRTRWSPGTRGAPCAICPSRTRRWRRPTTTRPPCCGSGRPGSSPPEAAPRSAALHTAEGGADAPADRDLPALRRLRSLTSFAHVEGARPELLEAVAEQLAPEPLLVPERALVLAESAALTLEPAALPARLRDLAAALEGAGVTTVIHTAGRLRIFSPHHAHPDGVEALLTAADRLVRDGGAAQGLLVTGLVRTTGGALGWPEEWRALLRRHPHADVRREAYTTLTDRE